MNALLDSVVFLGLKSRVGGLFEQRELYARGSRMSVASWEWVEFGGT